MDKPLSHYDKRIVRRSIGKDYLTQEEFDEFINTLPDRAADSEPLVLEEEVKAAPPAEAAQTEAGLEPLPEGGGASATVEDPGPNESPLEDPVENKEDGA